MKTTTLLCCAMLGLTSPLAIAQDQQQQFEQQGKLAIKEFATTLKGALLTAMKSGGPTEAIHVCNQVAPTIAASLSEKYGFEIGRTSLKVRNPENVADAWENQVLTRFEQQKQAGKPIKTLVFSEQVSSDNGQEFRMMKAIPTGKICLKCHGSTIAEPVLAALNTLYPEDQATGFKEGDIRGAFTLRKPSEE